MGFDADCVLNSNSIPRELFCPICGQLVSPRDAQQIPCGHIYCQPCVAYLSSTSQNCPQDGHVVNQLDVKSLREADYSLYSTLEKVLVRCLYYRSGCIWHGDLVTCEGHISSCLYGSFPVQCNRCGLQMVHRQVQEHARTCSATAQQAQEQTATYQKPGAESVQPDQRWDTSSVSLQSSQQTHQWYQQQYQSYYQQQQQQGYHQQYQPLQQSAQQQHYYPTQLQIEQRQQQIGHLEQPLHLQHSLTKDQPYVHQQGVQQEQQKDYQQSWDRYHLQWNAWHVAQAANANTQQSLPGYQQHGSNWYGQSQQQMQQQAHGISNQQSISQQQYAPGQPLLALHTSEGNGLGTSVEILQRRLGGKQLEKAGIQDGTTVHPLLQGQHSIPQLAPLPGMAVLPPGISQHSMLRQNPRSPLPDSGPLSNGLQPSDLSSASIPEAFVNGKDKGDDTGPGDKDPPVYSSDIDLQSRAPAGTGRLPSQALERHLALSSQSQRPLLPGSFAGDSESLRGVSPPGFIPRPDYMAHRSHIHRDYAREPNAIEPDRLRHRALRPLDGSGVHPGHLNGMQFAAEDPRIHITSPHIDMIGRGSYMPPFLHLPNGGHMQHFLGAEMGRKRKFLESSGWCRICQIDCFSVEGLQQHSQSPEHQEKAMQMVLNIKRGNAKKLKL